jgi:nitrate/nitrite transporter NarK
MAILYVCVSFGWSFFASWIPRYFKDVHKLPMADSEWHTALPPLFGCISCLVGGALCDYLVKRTGRKRLFRALFPVAGYTTAALACLAIRFTRSPEQAAVICCVVAAAADFGQGANWSSIVDIGGRYAGIAAGLINTIGNLGHLQPVFGQAIFNSFGWDALFVVYACFFAVGASMWLFIDPTKRFHRDEDPQERGFPVVMPAAAPTSR